MNIKERLPGMTMLVLLLLGAGFVAFMFLGVGAKTSVISVKVPDLSALAGQGKVVFDANCASCHGVNAGGGTGNGPPLVHKIYKAGHHVDQAFVLAARNGVRAHHWPFGSMPKQPQVSLDDVAAIVRYVRELQRANGI